MDADQARRIFAAANVGFGVAFLAFPRLSLRLYGLDPQRDRSAAFALRWFGSRCLLVAAMAADDDTAEAVFKHLPEVAALDASACLAALVTGEVPKRAVVLSVLSSAATNAVGFQARALS